MEELCTDCVSASFDIVLKPQQVEIITNCLQGRDVFGILPTGFGKSICFQCLPICFNQLKGCTGSVVIVVTPLLGIMDDQVHDATRTGLTAASISSSTSLDVIKGVLSGKYSLVYFSPELILTKKWKQLIRSSSRCPIIHIRCSHMKRSCR